MNSESDEEDISISIKILKIFKLIEYINTLAENPQGLSRIELRKKVPISSVPELKITDLLYKFQIIENARTIKGRKFKLSKNGLNLYKIMQGFDVFISKLDTKNILNPDEIDRIDRAIETLTNFKKNKEDFKEKMDKFLDMF